MRRKVVAGNWKMNGRRESIKALVQSLRSELTAWNAADCIVFPPALYIPEVQALTANTGIQLGGQNVYPKADGAMTGELSAPMFKEFGAAYILVGHSERRHLLHESEKFVAEKFHHVKEHDMIPVLCVGETLEEREKGLTEAVIARQLAAVLQDGQAVFERCIVAYEPVWAIGTGHTANPEQAQAVHEFIRAWIREREASNATMLPILYGGSVNEKNAKALFAMPDVDGGLVGGASLDARQFVEIVKCIN